MHFLLALLNLEGYAQLPPGRVPQYRPRFFFLLLLVCLLFLFFSFLLLLLLLLLLFLPLHQWPTLALGALMMSRTAMDSLLADPSFKCVITVDARCCGVYIADSCSRYPYSAAPIALDTMTTAVFPCVQMVSPTTQLTGNFGQQDFYFAIGQHIAQERSSAVCQAVDNKLTSELANSKMRRPPSEPVSCLMRMWAQLLGTSSTCTTYTTWPPKHKHKDFTQQGVERLTSRMREIARGHVTKEPSQPDSQTTSQPLYTTHIGLTAREWMRGDGVSGRGWRDLGEVGISGWGGRRRGVLGSLVFDYLLRHGFSDTAIALAPIIETSSAAQQTNSDIEGEQLESRKKISESVDSAGGVSNAESSDHTAGEEWPESFEAVKRRLNLIRLIEAGHFLEAITELSANYVNLVHQAPAIVFMLRCRHFIEMTTRKPFCPRRRVRCYALVRLVDLVGFPADFWTIAAFRCNANMPSSESSTSAEKPLPKACLHKVPQKRTQPSSSPESSPEILLPLASRRCEAPAPVRMKLDNEDEFFSGTAYSGDFRTPFGDSQEQLEDGVCVCDAAEESVMAAETLHANINGFSTKKREVSKRSFSHAVATESDITAAAGEVFMNGDVCNGTAVPPALPLSNGVRSEPPPKLTNLSISMSNGSAMFGSQATSSVPQGSRDSQLQQHQMEITSESTIIKQEEPAQTNLRELLEYGRALRNLAQNLRAGGLISFSQLSLMETIYLRAHLQTELDFKGDLVRFFNQAYEDCY
ncbi:unnamed protein product [Schistocephalus solidus]|uniref:CTLH domain-containing protein n=1 Tax=Schistocephalus solidus TaxID=70667 RepID=A0A183T166_SCHSO|nr:unnamed protein product [Schistocephalus solidus]